MNAMMDVVLVGSGNGCGRRGSGVSCQEDRRGDGQRRGGRRIALLLLLLLLL